MADKWETVQSKSSKKLQQNKSKANGGVTNKRSDPDAPKAPVFGERSQYDSLATKEKKVSAAPVKESSNGAPKPKSSIPRPHKKDSSKKQGSKPKLETLVSSLNGSQFEEMFVQSQNTFKDTPLMWLRELTVKLNSQLDLGPQTDCVFADKPEDFPSSLLKNDVKKVLNKSLRECSTELLQLFLSNVIDSTLTDLGKGTSVYGYQMVVQLLAKYKPELFTLTTEKYLDVVINNKNVPVKCLAVMWILGQGGHHHFKTGLKVWVQLMLQVIGIKSLAQYSVTYLGHILQMGKVEQGFGVIKMKDYFLILDGVFTSNKNLQPAIQKSLRAHYPALKKLSFGNNPKETMHKFFPSFLTRVSVDGANAELQKEVLDNVLYCIALDPQCLSLWSCNLYSQHLPQSSVVLNLLATNLSRNTRQGVDYSKVREAVTSFKALNSQTSKSTPGLDACVAACARFEEVHTVRVESSKSTVKSLFIVSSFILAGLLVFDSYRCGTFAGSTTGKLLKDTGADVYLSLIMSRITAFLSAASTFLFSNVPIWLNVASKYVGPVLDTAWNYALDLLTYLLEVSTPLRNWLQDTIPPIIDSVIMHPYWTVLYETLVSLKVAADPYIDMALLYINPLLERVRSIIF